MCLHSLRCNALKKMAWESSGCVVSDSGRRRFGVDPAPVFDHADTSPPPPFLTFHRYEYAMHGKVYNVNHKEGEHVEIDVSYGGLLMRLSGDQR